MYYMYIETMLSNDLFKMLNINYFTVHSGALKKTKPYGIGFSNELYTFLPRTKSYLCHC